MSPDTHADPSTGSAASTHQPMLDAQELNDLAAFASKGGLGVAVALSDCVAEQPDQLMFLTHDELVILRDMGPTLIASCEGVVGWVKREDVDLRGLAGTGTAAGPSPMRESLIKGGVGEGMPRTIVVAPSPSPSPPLAVTPRDDAVPIVEHAKTRSSNQFDLDSPVPTPSEAVPVPFAAQQEEITGSVVTAADRARLRESYASVESDTSSALGGIGGLLMGDGDHRETRSEHGTPRKSEVRRGSEEEVLAYGKEPGDETGKATSPTTSVPRLSPVSATYASSVHSAQSGQTGSSQTWDIYDSYARESMYVKPAPALALEVPPPPASVPQRRASEATSEGTSRRSDVRSYASVISDGSFDDEGQAFEAARRALERVGQTRQWAEEEAEVEARPAEAAAPPPRPPRRRPVEVQDDPITPKPARSEREIDPADAQSLAAALHQKLDAEGSPDAAIAPRVAGLRLANPDDDSPPSPVDSMPPSSTPSAPGSSAGHDTSTPLSSKLLTPLQVQDDHLSRDIASVSPTPTPLVASPLMSREPSQEPVISKPLLGSPLPLDDPSRLTSPALPSDPRRPSLSARSPSIGTPRAEGMTPPMPPWSPVPGTPGSPHSIAATRQAVEVGRKTPPASAGSRKVTLVGRMDADLSAAKGPVPITFTVNDPLAPAPPARAPNGLGLGLPSSSPLLGGRSSPLGSPLVPGRPHSPASPVPPPFIEDTENALKNAPSPYPSMRSATNPPEDRSKGTDHSPGPKPGFFPRPRSRSFSAAMTKALGKKPTPALTIDTDAAQAGIPAVPRQLSSAQPQGSGSMPKRPFFSRQSSMPQTGPARSTTPTTATTLSVPASEQPPPSPALSINPDLIRTGTTPSPSPTIQTLIPPRAAESSALLTPSSARSCAFPFRKVSKGSKTSLGPSTPRALPSPVSHKDFVDQKSTVKADGLDFEIVQPRRNGSVSSPSSEHLSPSPPKVGSLLSSKMYASASSLDTLSVGHGEGDLELRRKGTIHSAISASSAKSTRTLPETDEWGFVKDRRTTPEIYLGRSGGAEQRASEQKWLAIISTPLSGPTPKKVRKLALEHGVPASLRGRVWAWFMAGHMSTKRPGLYQELLDHWKANEPLERRIDLDVERAYPDHSIYSETSTGQSDLRSILRAYSNFATGGYRSEMALVAGMLLIHCVAEDAFWLFAGFVNGVLREYYASPSAVRDQPSDKRSKATGLKVDAGVFVGVLWGSEPKLGRLFKDMGIHPVAFLERWWTQLFIRCLPWPTALRVIDAVVAEGPRFLIIAALAILTVSKERLMGMARQGSKAILAYLDDLPHDALLLPESFMRACEQVKFREEDYRKLKGSVEKELGIV